MKKGWTYKKLGEVCEKSKNINWNNITAGEQYIYIDLSSVDRDSLSITDPQIIDKTNAPSRAKQIVKNGDVIFATTRPTLRRLCLIPLSFDSQICSTGFCVLRPKKDIDPRWIYYTLQGDKFYQYIEPLQTGASYPAVTDGIVKEYSILIPPLSEQKRIVSRLDSAFAHIDALKANAEKQLSDAKALFQKALEKAMEPKEGWEEKKIGDLFKTYAGGTPLKSGENYYEGGTIPWIRSGEVCQKYINACELYITEDGMKNSSAKYYPVNTILVAMYGATAAQVGILKFEATSNQAVCGILPRKDFIPEYIYYWFVNIQKELASQAQGGAQPNLSQVKIKKVLLSYPPLSEQQAIVSRLDQLSEKVKRLQKIQEKTIKECDALKQAMLRQVFE